jgi:hypothetical protein
VNVLIIEFQPIRCIFARAINDKFITFVEEAISELDNFSIHAIASKTHMFIVRRKPFLRIDKAALRPCLDIAISLGVRHLIPCDIVRPHGAGMAHDRLDPRSQFKGTFPGEHSLAQAGS